METEEILEKIKECRENSKPRNFEQSFELIVTLKLDMRKPENRINEWVRLPNGRGNEASIVVFSDEVKEVEGAEILNSEDIKSLSKREAKKLASSVDFFLAEPKLMPLIGRFLGPYLGPRGKMPFVVGSKEEMEKQIAELKHSIRLKTKTQPQLQCLIGKEKMNDEAIAENIKAILNFLEKRLPKGKQDIEKIWIKLSMGKPVRLR